MGIFTSKTHILPNNAMIGELDANGDMQWAIVEWDYVQALIGVLEDRGHREINGIVYKLYYLPAPPHTHTTTTL